ncbi:hypothetical protein HAX54_033018 [Datura stramonium]|uniref:Uncharacterized protein n=1 Tax=Datura stramonium TaxID=4076 RepID=A0ABS8VCY1_DATST|nr:hypothetical protein [Datura stramonium]
MSFFGSLASKIALAFLSYELVAVKLIIDSKNKEQQRILFLKKFVKSSKHRHSATTSMLHQEGSEVDVTVIGIKPIGPSRSEDMRPDTESEANKDPSIMKKVEILIGHCTTKNVVIE